MGLFSRKKISDELEVPLAPQEEIKKEELEVPEAIIEERSIIPEELLEKPKELVEHEIPTKPLFLDIDSFKEILEELGMIKTILKEAEDAASRTEDFTLDEDKELKRWKNLVSDTQKKIIYCEKTLFR